jgi:hypothetical protein
MMTATTLTQGKGRVGISPAALPATQMGPHSGGARRATSTTGSARSAKRLSRQARESPILQPGLLSVTPARSRPPVYARRGPPDRKLPRGTHGARRRYGDAQTLGLGRIPVFTKEGLAWARPLPLAGSRDRQHGGTADGRRSEPEAHAEPAGLGMAPVLQRVGRSHPPGVPAPTSPDAVTVCDHPDQRGLRYGTALDLPFFNTLAPSRPRHTWRQRLFAEPGRAVRPTYDVDWRRPHP